MILKLEAGTHFKSGGGHSDAKIKHLCSVFNMPKLVISLCDALLKEKPYFLHVLDPIPPNTSI